MDGNARKASAAKTRVPGSIFLVGLMGAGKTSVGKVLARRLGKAFYDCDHEIERATGVKVPVIFDIEGEAGFRAREARVLAELVTRTDIVLATGGGAVTRESSRRCLKERGTVLYLHASPETLWGRVRNSRNRPMLKVGDPRERIAALYAERDPLYRDIADHVIESERDAVMRFARSFATGVVEDEA